MGGAVPYGCGQCLPCRINRARKWQWRQVLESMVHEHNSFVTLTYSNDHLPAGGHLVPKDLQRWFYKLRKALRPTRVRYYAVGEYGSTTRRPHYHISLFGVGYFQNYGVQNRSLAEIVNQSWGLGLTHVAPEFNEQTAGYVSRYMVKHLENRKDEWYDNHFPEFARMSRRPGLGYAAMTIVASTLLSTAHGWESGDVPKQLKIGRRSIPLDRYLLNALRLAVGFEDDYIKELKEELGMERALELLAVFKNNDDFTFSETHKKMAAQRAEQVEARYQIWNSHSWKRKDAL